jgi:protein gp37
MPTKIEWTDETWNPVRGCSKISLGCKNCYAERMAMRFCGDGDVDGPSITSEHFTDGGVEFQKDFPFWRFATKKGWTGKVELMEHKLAEPLHWRKPRRVFVNSMSDLFHESLPDEARDEVFAVMAAAWWHEYQILTKRGRGMFEYFAAVRKRRPIPGQGVCTGGPPFCGCDPASGRIHEADVGYCGTEWPLRNVHLGVSVEDQQTADERIPWLLKTPAAVRFVSAEPLLGPVDFTRIGEDADDGAWWSWDVLRGFLVADGRNEHTDTEKIDQIIVGGESGPSARPMAPDWARSIRDQCQVAKVPYFHKQNGEWAERSFGISNKMLVRVGKRSAGRLLDGVEWNECPADICVREEAPS